MILPQAMDENRVIPPSLLPQPRDQSRPESITSEPAFRPCRYDLQFLRLRSILPRKQGRGHPVSHRRMFPRYGTHELDGSSCRRFQRVNQMQDRATHDLYPAPSGMKTGAILAGLKARAHKHRAFSPVHPFPSKLPPARRKKFFIIAGRWSPSMLSAPGRCAACQKRCLAPDRPCCRSRRRRGRRRRQWGGRRW